MEHGEGRCGSSTCPALLALTGFSTPGGHSAGVSSTGGAGGTGSPPLTDFSFFVTNMAAIDDSVGAGGGYGGFYRFAGMR